MRFLHLDIPRLEAFRKTTVPWTTTRARRESQDQLATSERALLHFAHNPKLETRLSLQNPHIGIRDREPRFGIVSFPAIERTRKSSTQSRTDNVRQGQNSPALRRVRSEVNDLLNDFLHRML